MHDLSVIDIVLGQAPPAVVAPDYGFFSSVLNAGFGEKIVMGILLVFSILSWGVIALKWLGVRRAAKTSEVFLEAFWSSKRLDSVYQKSEKWTASPVSQVFRAGYIE